MIEHGNDVPAAPARVVVVGAAGFVGNAIAARLERDQVPVLRLPRREVDLLAADGADRLAAQLRREDVLVAAAAIAPCRYSVMLRNNTIIAAAMLKAAATTPLAQVVNISSDAIYADSPFPLTEASMKAPESLHGVMHLAREIMFTSEIKAPLVMLRPTLIYGAADPHSGYGPNRFRRLAAAGEPIALFGKGEERRDYVLIDDVAELAARVICRRSAGALNIATGMISSFREIAEMVARISARPVPIQELPRTGPMPHKRLSRLRHYGMPCRFPGFFFCVTAARIDEDDGSGAKPSGRYDRLSRAGDGRHCPSDHRPRDRRHGADARSFGDGSRPRAAPLDCREHDRTRCRRSFAGTSRHRTAHARYAAGSSRSAGPCARCRDPARGAARHPADLALPRRSSGDGRAATGAALRSVLECAMRRIDRCRHCEAAIGLVLGTAARRGSQFANGKRFHEQLGYQPRRWEHIPNGCDTNVFRFDAKARLELRHDSAYRTMRSRSACRHASTR